MPATKHYTRSEVTEMIAFLNMARAYIAEKRDREEGQGIVEYTLIIGTISLVIVAAFLTTDIEGAIENLASGIATAIDP